MSREVGRSQAHEYTGSGAARHESVGTPGKRTLTADLPSGPVVDGPFAASATPGTNDTNPMSRRGSVDIIAGTAGRSAALVDREPEGASADVPPTQAPMPQQATATSGQSGAEPPSPGARAPGTVRDAPTATYLVPFDRHPLAAPGERIICSAEFTGGANADYEIAYSTVGGHFTSAAGPTTLTVQGLISGNVNFFVPTPWNGTDAVSVTMQLKKKSDGSVVQTETWSFGKKTYYPTTMTQREGTGERTLPGVYNYDIGAARPSGTPPFYEHQTILEWFDNWSISNIVPADIAEAYRNAHGLTSAAAITTHFIGAYAGSNGTFTVNGNDRIADQHGGQPNVDNLVNNLAAPKDIEIALPQTYEAQPGTALGRYMVTRVHKADGSWKVKKAPR